MTKLAYTLEAIHRATNGSLEAHPSFISAGLGAILDNTNGCGAEGAKFDFVPDTIWGLPIMPACIIHDWDYHTGRTKHDKRRADVRFLVNMVLLILDGSNWVTTILRTERAVKYFLAVTIKGDEAYWSGKDETNT